MKKAWVENGLIFIGPQECVPKDATDVINVPDDTEPEDIEIKNGTLVLKSTEKKLLEKLHKLRDKIKEEVLYKSDKKVEQILKEHGYRSIGDLKLYADLNTPEAVSLLEQYLRFDDLVWKFIDEDLQEMSLQELEEFNVDEFIENCCRNGT